MKEGLTLLELIAVIIIISVLASLANLAFSTGRERALGKEAQANLKLIQDAQNYYKLEEGYYYPVTGTSLPVDNVDTINTDLKLALTESSWDYKITAASTNSFTATAERNDSGSGGYYDCVYTINQDSREPAYNVNCPQ